MLEYFESLGLAKPSTMPDPEFLQQVTSTPRKFVMDSPQFQVKIGAHTSFVG